jgi:chemotaxis protein CheX
VDVSYINPFIEAVDSVFTTMLETKPARDGLKVSDGGGNEVLVTALVGLTGKVSGVVALRFPPATALVLAGRMLGSEQTEINEEVTDAISEMANMVAGSAKARFNHDPPLQLGLPTVVEGAGYKLRYPSKSAWLQVPFNSDAGRFTMEVTYNSN